MSGVDALGFLAAGLVFATFSMKRLVPLRAVAISSNLVFILYGYSAGLKPVLVLYLILVPMTVFLLLQAVPVRLPAIPGGLC